MKKPKQSKQNKNLVRKTEQETLISPRLNEEFVRFVDYYPVKRLATNLRTLLLEFLMYDGSAEAEYLKPLAVDLSGLFDLLDAIENERPMKVVVEA
jgi:hypothetical protein